jgi:hypothetical protein
MVPVSLLPAWLRAIAPVSRRYWALSPLRWAVPGTPGSAARGRRAALFAADRLAASHTDRAV